MEDLLMSAARTIVEQSKRIDELESICDQLGCRLNVLEANHQATQEHASFIETRVTQERQRNESFINNLNNAINQYRNSRGY